VRTTVIARFTVKEALRRRVILAGFGLTVVFLSLFAIGAHFAVLEIETSSLLLPSFRPVVISQLLLSGVWVVSMASALLAIFASAGTLGAEIESHTLHAIASKPVGRWEIVAGKWLGLAAMLTTYTTLAGSAVILVVWVRAGYVPPSPPLALLALIVQGLVLVSISLLGSAVLPPLVTGISVFMLHAIAMVGGLQEQIGYVLRNEVMQGLGVCISLIIPSDAMARLAAASLQATSGATTVMPGPFNVPAPPSAWMMAYAVLYLAACVLGAIEGFERRDL
jgi:ABC-type transport system involved in multi-copper enzyme maturation permease subunit